MPAPPATAHVVPQHGVDFGLRGERRDVGVRVSLAVPDDVEDGEARLAHVGARQARERTQEAPRHRVRVRVPDARDACDEDVAEGLRGRGGVEVGHLRGDQVRERGRERPAEGHRAAVGAARGGRVGAGRGETGCTRPGERR